MRQFKDVAIEEGRDAGKVFRVTELDAYSAEKWIARLVFAAGRSNAPLSDQAAAGGIGGLLRLDPIAILQIIAGIPWELAEPLWDQMFSCVSRVVPAAPLGRVLVADDIEEFGTRFQLRKIWLEVQFGFYLGGGPSTSDLPPDPASTPLNT